MSGRYLLDTNIIIALFNFEDAVISALEQAEEVFIPSIVLGELHYGAQKSGRSAENLERLFVFSAESTIVNCDSHTAAAYGEVKNKLRLKGRPLPENDVWIAAIALQHNMTLVSRDAHFQQVENLQVLSW